MDYIENRPFDEIKVGDSASLVRTLTRDDINIFAAMSGDVNPAHLDEEFAGRIGTGLRVAYCIDGAPGPLPGRRSPAGAVPGAAQTSIRSPPALARHRDDGGAYTARGVLGYAPEPSSARFAHPAPTVLRLCHGRLWSG